MRLFCLLSLIAVIIAGGMLPAEAAADANRIRFVNHLGRRHVYLSDVASYYRMQTAVDGSNIALIGRKFNMRMTVDRTRAFINDVCVYMFFPPASRNGQVLISETDLLLLIEPVFRDRSVPRHLIRTIMIDPGHGGNDEGARGRLYREKDLALRLSLKVKNELERLGYRVVMTRSDDRAVSLEQRVVACANTKADLFISIHCNKADNTSVSGIETFVLPAAGAQSTHGSRNNARVSGNRFDANNTKLGYEIQSSLIRKTGANDRGLKRARFYVLRNAPCPAILIEAGFLSNRMEERRLGNDAYQDKIASAIAEGIFRYHRSILKSDFR